MQPTQTSLLKSLQYSDPPVILRSTPNWVLWRYYGEGSDRHKCPYTPKTGRVAKTNDPATWGTYDEASWWYRRRSKRYCGVGFIFAEGGGLFGVDLDGCIADGIIQPWADIIRARFKTYTEISPSGTGLKMFGIGDIPPDVKLRKKVNVPPCTNKTPGIEVYGKLRLFCYTGRAIGAHRELHDCQRPLTALLKKIQPPESTIRFKRNNSKERGKFSVEHARKWLASHGPAISGNDGHTHTFRAALALVKGFSLDEPTALDLLREWNRTCAPPWSDRELNRKIQQAIKKC